MIVLGIETSCDETAVGIVDSDAVLLANTVYSQAQIHARWGGVVPEIASREHISQIERTLRLALKDARLELNQIDAVAVTNGPGLAGGLLVGVNFAKGLAVSLKVPLIGVNHLEGHIAAAWIDDDTQNASKLRTLAHQGPLACLLVSGGHTELVVVSNQFEFELVGVTRDDAAGEAFDKVARVMGLPYPGGPPIQALAEKADGTPIKPLPRAWLRGTHDFSFSGLKTETSRRAQSTDGSEPSFARLACEFQNAVADVLVTKTVALAAERECAAILLVGGVAANRVLRDQLRQRSSLPVVIPPIQLCTDNGAMIAMRGLQIGGQVDAGDDLDIISDLQVGERH